MQQTNASINIRNYALGMSDERHAIKEKTRRVFWVGIIRSYACFSKQNACPAKGVVIKYGYIPDIASYGSLKQEVQSSLVGGSLHVDHWQHPTMVLLE
ncbi:hypothetical protein [Helicobacter salomonis]|uniref:hypothetical protein n=1 Tax=Helicobacter salomonis TaxID=56878 RepID=UPI0013150B2E|nr:hypothetical protein [Helicobacter salomonis]